MLMFLIVYIYIFYVSVLCINGPNRIAPGRFRFDEDIAHLKEDQKIDTLQASKNSVKTAGVKAQTQTDSQHQKGEPIDKKGKQVKRHHHEESFIGLAASKSPPLAQSIGYTVESYPNPVTNPELCLHSSNGVHSMICDPDGILTEDQQRELNEVLRKQGNYQIFAALANTILVMKDEKDPQRVFASDLLNEWQNETNKCIVMVYAANQGKLNIATNIEEGALPLDKIKQIERAFELDHSNVSEALKRSILAVEGCITNNRISMAVICVTLLLFATAICVSLTCQKRKRN